MKYFKEKRLKRNTLLMIISIVCIGILSVTLPKMVYAKNARVKNPAKANVSLNTTYNRYDVTGDGKADTIRISSVSLEADEWDVGLKVEINGKEVLYNKDCYYYGIEASLCTLKNGKVYLYLYNPGDDGDAYYCGLYQYKNGKLECVLNMNKFYGSDKLGYHTNGEVKAVSGNKITVGIYQQNYELGGISVNFDYIYSKEKLVKSGNVAKDYKCWAAESNGGKLTANYDIKVYAEKSCKRKAFTLRRGEKIKIKSIYCKSGKMLLKVHRLSDGKKGYIKCIKHYPIKEGAPFKEVVYAG